MISYYEYTQAKKKAKIEQGKFLDDCYFLPNPVAQECLEKVLATPLRVVEAYKEHVRHWFVEPVRGADCIVVRFEDLVKRRHSEFQRVFDFLELGAPLAEHLTDVMTSLYSSEGRQRGQAYGWKDSTSRYGELLRAVNHSLGDEIVALGYELLSLTVCLLGQRKLDILGSFVVAQGISGEGRNPNPRPNRISSLQTILTGTAQSILSGIQMTAARRIGC